MSIPVVGNYTLTPQTDGLAQGSMDDPARAAERKTGGAKAFAAIWDAHHVAVFAFVRRKVPDDVAAEIVTATFAVLWRQLEGANPNPPAEPLPWLYAVARRQLANHRRKESRRNAALTHLTQTTASATAELDLDPAGTTVERATAVAALRNLRDADRELLMLVGWQGLDLTRAAEVLGVSEATLAVRLHRARRRLDRELDRLRSEGRP